MKKFYSILFVLIVLSQPVMAQEVYGPTPNNTSPAPYGPVPSNGTYNAPSTQPSADPAETTKDNSAYYGSEGLQGPVQVQSYVSGGVQGPPAPEPQTANSAFYGTEGLQGPVQSEASQSYGPPAPVRNFSSTKLDFSSFKAFLGSIYNILSLIVPIIVSLGVIAFLWGVLKYIRSGENETMLKEGKDFILYGLVGIFAMVSVWGLVGIVTNSFFSESGSGSGYENMIQRVKNSTFFPN